jgi:hypothetical protein
MYHLTIADNLNHLEKTHRKLLFFLNEVENGNSDLIVDLALLIRILFMKKSQTEALFGIIEKQLNIKLMVWVRETFDEELKRKGLDHLIDQPTYSFTNEIDSWLLEGKYKVGLIEAFNRPKSIHIKGNSYSANDMVAIVADKLGGAHIDQKLNERVLSSRINNISFGGYNTSDYVILQTTRQTIKIIEALFDFIKSGKVSEFIELAK